MIALPAALLAQPAALMPGARVRASILPSGQRIVGNLAEPLGDSLTLHVRRGPGLAAPVMTRTFARAAVKDLELSSGVSRWGGAKRGALVFAAGGLLFGLVAGPVENDGGGPSGEFMGMLLAGVFAPVGAVIGAVFYPTERWERVTP
jgi:hypothetical protein